VSYHYIDRGYAIVASESASTHQFGGTPYHAGAICPVCRIPLLLLADLDCEPIRLTENKELFNRLDRLPFYYCWRCCAEKLSYQVDKRSIKIFKNEGKVQGDDFPYAGFPATFPRQPVDLVPIPYEIAKLLVVAQEVGLEWLSENDQMAVQTGLESLRHSWFAKSSVNRHQIGGFPNLEQGHEYVVCPNPDCEEHKMAKRGRGCRMLELVVLLNDPHSGLPMCEGPGELSSPNDFNAYVQVVYWVCEKCLTLTASNRCD
jgi:hypothetical protein